MFNAGVVEATLGGNFRPAGFMAFDSAMHKAKRSMDDAEKSHSKMSKGMATVGKVGAGIAAGGILAVGLALGKSVKLAADFEQEMSNLKATTKANGAQMAIFKKQAMEAGAATKYSALDAAKAQTALAKGGLEVAQMGGGLKAALALAAAGEMDLTEAADTTVNAMKMFGIEGDKAMHVADALATAALTTTADVSDMAKALVMGGGAAKTAGLSFDETIATLSALADSSYKNSDAGTSMKAALVQLAAPSKKAAAEAKSLNLQLWDQNDSLKSLPAIAKELDKAFGGLTDRERIAAATTLAGTDGFRTLMALYESSPEAMQGYLDGQKKQGTAADVAAEKQDNLKGKIEQLKGSLETAGIALGEGLLPGLTEGAEKATDAINDMAASGQLDQLGRDLGSVIESLVDAGPQIAAGMQIAVGSVGILIDLIKMGVSGAIATVLIPVEALMTALLAAGKVFNALSPKDIDLGGLEGAIDKVNNFRQAFVDAGESIVTRVGDIAAAVDGLPAGKTLTVEVSAKVGAAISAIRGIDSQQIRAKVVTIAGKDISASQKIKQIVALGIPEKTARVIAEAGEALSKIGSVRQQLALINNKSITIGVTTRFTTVGTPTGQSGGRVKGMSTRAAGRGTGNSERALIGEGRGGELWGNPVDGWKWADGPTLVDLGPNDAVIPEDPAYSKQALGFMFAAMGVPGYHKGRGPHKHPHAKPKPLPIPDAVKFGAVPEEPLKKRATDAREDYQDRKDTVHDLDVKIKAQRDTLAKAKGKAKGPAREKLRKLQADRKRYNDGDGKLQSLAKMRQQWQSLREQAAVLHRFNQDIERMNTEQETERTKMATASKRGDTGGYDAARKTRTGLLGTLRDIYAKAVTLAKPGSNFAADLQGKLAGIEGEITDLGQDEPALTAAQQAAQDARDRLSETGMTDAERGRLADLQAAQSLAALTAGTGDDQAAAGGVEQFLTGILAAVQRDPATRGGSLAVRDIADQLAQARSNVASFTSGGGAVNDNADVQAQLDQSREREAISARRAEISDRALSVFQGAGDIGEARIVQNVYTLHPGDPRTLAAIADASVAGISQQASVTSPRTYTGL